MASSSCNVDACNSTIQSYLNRGWAYTSSGLASCRGCPVVKYPNKLPASAGTTVAAPPPPPPAAPPAPVPVTPAAPICNSILPGAASPCATDDPAATMQCFQKNINNALTNWQCYSNQVQSALDSNGTVDPTLAANFQAATAAMNAAMSAYNDYKDKQAASNQNIDDDAATALLQDVLDKTNQLDSMRDQSSLINMRLQGGQTRFESQKISMIKLIGAGLFIFVIIILWWRYISAKPSSSSSKGSSGSSSGSSSGRGSS